MAIHTDKMTLFALSSAGKKKHEDLTSPAPYSTIMAALYEAQNGLTIGDLEQRTNLREDDVKSSLIVLHKNRLITTSQPANSDAPTIRV